MKIYIIEGARGMGKSTIVRKLRDSMTNTLAINFTGNNEDSIVGSKSTYEHYVNWLQLISSEAIDGTPFNYIFDRFFFSEQVYATKYKSYNFTEKYKVLLRRLTTISERSNVEVTVIHLTTSKEDLERNLQREGKAHLFDDERYADNVHKSMEQNVEYFKLFKEAESECPAIRFLTADLTGLTLDESVKYVQSLIQ